MVTKHALTSFLCCWGAGTGAGRSEPSTDFYILQTTEPNKKGVARPDVVACTALMKALRAGGNGKGERLLQVRRAETRPEDGGGMADTHAHDLFLISFSLSLCACRVDV